MDANLVLEVIKWLFGAILGVALWYLREERQHRIDHANRLKVLEEWHTTMIARKELWRELGAPERRELPDTDFSRAMTESW